MSNTPSSCKTDILRSDAEYLMQSSKKLIKPLGWNWKTPIHEWKGVTVGKNQRITKLDFEGFLIGAEGVKALVLPPGLQELNLRENIIGNEGAKALNLPLGLKKLNIGDNTIGAEGAKAMVLPPGLQTLDLSWNFIGNECIKDLVLPSGLRELDLGVNDIGDEGVKALALPPGLQELILHNNKIGLKGAEALVLPPGLKKLDLGYNYIHVAAAKGLILPPGLQKLELGYNYIHLPGVKGLQRVGFMNNYVMFSKKLLDLNSARPRKCIHRYLQTYPQYQKYFCKPFYFEICRCLIFGRTEDPIFQFLQSISGATNIRKQILLYFNPFNNMSN